MKKIILILTILGFLSACSTFEKRAYEHFQEKQVEKDNQFKTESNQAEEFSKEDYQSYEQYIKEKDLVLDEKQKESDKD